MSADTFKLLEFDELLSLLESYVRCPLGKAKLRSLILLQELDMITARQQLAAQAREYLESNIGPNRESREAKSGTARQEQQLGMNKSGSLPRDKPSPTLPLNFSGLSDPAPALSKAALDGGTLEIPEIVELLSLAEKAADIKRSLLAAAGRFKQLADEASRIGNFHFLLKQLRGKILPSGELDDHASPELKRIRRAKEKQRALIHSSLRNFLRSQTEEASAQEQIITIRGERFVVPIRMERKGRVKGIVHGSSSSGQTVYVEPLETMDLNNDLVRLMEEEKREIFRILKEMTSYLRQQSRELAETAECLGVLDLAFACGRFAIEYECVIPRFSPASGPVRLVLQDARHPLLEALLRKKGVPVVPISLAMEGEDRVLVISGPNTGGKTVALKTVGLLALMAMAGLPVPAADAEFPVFDRILADIGDYQSIQESLSTFSAHLLNISSMIGSASRGSLVLLDEVGSATDPEEAGALGVAVVDRFRSAGAFTIVSTHHLALKAYATNTS
ncbi:MAG: endonuclease MutS2, partial [Acidobacteriota bacterium]